MLMTVFLLLNGLGVIFLLYVLRGFWKDGHRRASRGQEFVAEFSPRKGVSILVVTEPISGNQNTRSSVIPFALPRREPAEQQAQRVLATQVSEFPARRISTR